MKPINRQNDREECDVVIEEDNFEPTEQEIREYALYLGIDLNSDKDLLWIAEKGLKAPVPKPWKPCCTADKEIYYFNFETGESSWEHPSDKEFKQLYQTEKTNKLRMKIDMEYRLAKEVQVSSLLHIVENGTRTH